MGTPLIRRLIFLAIALIGAAIWVAELPINEEAGPLPGRNLKVRLNVDVRFGGNYFVEVSMPKVGNTLAHEPLDIIRCDFYVTIAKAGTEVYSQHIETMSSATEIGWTYTQQYVGGASFRLDHGMYDATISAGEGCPVAAARGASVSVAREYKEHIVGSLLLNVFAWTLILVGVSGIVIDAKRRPT